MNNCKQLIKNFALAVLVVPAMYSCSDWTDVEAVDYHYTLPSEQDPEAYNAYLALLKEYKQNSHKILIAKFDNSKYEVSGQADRLSALPDSTDFIVLQAADSLNPVIEQEMKEVREQKGTRTLYALDYADVEAQLQAILDKEEAEATESDGETESPAPEEGTGQTEGTEQTETPDADRFIEVCTHYADSLLALYDKYGYDGILAVYNNIAYPGSMTEEEKAQLQARQDAFFGKIRNWAESHPDAPFLFEGKPENLVDASILSHADYIIIPGYDAGNINEVLWNAEMSLAEGVPSDRIVFGVAIPSLTDEKATDGYFNGTEYAVIETASNIASDEGSFVKAGLCVKNVRDDYFNPEHTYTHIRQAIQIMN